MKTEIVDRRNLLQGKGYLFNLIGNFSFIDLNLVFCWLSQYLSSSRAVHL